MLWQEVAAAGSRKLRWQGLQQQELRYRCGAECGDRNRSSKADTATGAVAGGIEVGVVTSSDVFCGIEAEPVTASAVQERK